MSNNVNNDKVFNEIFNKSSKTMKNHEAVGQNKIPIEMYENNEFLKSEMKDVINDIWTNESFPNECANGDAVMFYKRGDKNKHHNSPPLTMLNHEFKVFFKLILTAPKGDIDEHSDDTQNGFRESRSTRDNLLVLRWIKHLILSSKLKKLAMFTDHEEAFPSVAHNQTLRSLYGAQMNPNLIKLVLKHVRILYKHSNNTLGPWFEVNPVLFCFSHHNVAKTNNLHRILITNLVTSQSSMGIEEELHAADDTVFCEDHKITATEVNVLNDANKKSKPSSNIHPDKTEILVISKQNVETAKQQNKIV